MSRYRLFDRNRLQVRPLRERPSLVSWQDLIYPDVAPPVADCPEGLSELADAIVAARQRGRPVILFFGGHVIKQGLAPILADLVRRGYVTHLATNGSGLIHDYELARHGATSEPVPETIRDGRFGLWLETAELNRIVRAAASAEEGIGEAVGRHIVLGKLPYPHLSIFAAAWEEGIPATCHVAIGQDIVHEHPNCDGAAWGAATYTDFLIFAAAIERLQGGVFLNVGSAVAGPEVYLKALSMARNVAAQQGRSIAKFTTAVFDIVPLDQNWRQGTPPPDQPGYYFRPWKTILIRTVADGGTSYYVRGEHRVTLPWLSYLLRQRAAGEHWHRGERAA